MPFHEFLDDCKDHYCMISCDSCKMVPGGAGHDYAFGYVKDGWEITRDKGDWWNGRAICPKCSPKNVIPLKWVYFNYPRQWYWLKENEMPP